jgi:hypothetical protein
VGAASVGVFATGAATGGRQPQGRGRRRTQMMIGAGAYQLTRWSNTYSGAGAGASSQWNLGGLFPHRRAACGTDQLQIWIPKADEHDGLHGVDSRLARRSQMGQRTKPLAR